MSSNLPPVNKRCFDGGKPSLEDFIRRFIIDDPFSSDEKKDRLLAGYLIGRLQEGDVSFLDKTDETAARLVEDVQTILSCCATSMREQLVADRAQRYFAMKRSIEVANQPSAPTPKKRPQEGLHPRTPHPACPAITAAHTGVVTTALAESASTQTQDTHTPPPRKIWISSNVTLKRTYDSLAHCKDDLGPCLVIKRTRVASPLVPPNHFSFEAELLRAGVQLPMSRCVLHGRIVFAKRYVSPVSAASRSQAIQLDGLVPTSAALLVVTRHETGREISKKPRTSSARQNGSRLNHRKGQEAVTSQLYKQWLSLYSESQWLVAGATLRDIFHTQFVNHVKQVRKSKVSQTIRRVEFFGDIGQVIRDHAIDWRLLEQLVLNGEYEPESKFGDEHLMTSASVLKAKHVIRPLKPSCDRNAHWEAIVLDADCVVEDRRWKELHGAPDTKHKTGPDPRNRTLVLSSYTLLHNLVHARNAGWDISASIDGTHKVSNTSYILHVLGVNGIGRNGQRRFYPIAYGFGEGEREIVALHTILNVKYAATKLFGVVDIKFNGGMVSDRSNALVNACSYCFPDTPMLQCYTHIIRKFKAAGEREGNGGYVQYLKGNDSGWLNHVAQQDVRHLHKCKTLEQFLLMWSLVRQAWESAGEGEMARIFHESYIADPLFRKWYYTASGIPGCVPDNNPVEAHNKLTKGSHDFDGYCYINTNLRTAIAQELPSLIRHASEARREPTMEIAVLDYEHIYKKEECTEWLKRFDFNIDVKPFRDNNGYLVNDASMLSVPITDADVERMLSAEQGTLDLCVADRSKLVEITTRFHKICWVRSATVPEHVACDCHKLLSTSLVLSIILFPTHETSPNRGKENTNQ